MASSFWRMRMLHSHSRALQLRRASLLTFTPTAHDTAPASRAPSSPMGYLCKDPNVDTSIWRPYDSFQTKWLMRSPPFLLSTQALRFSTESKSHDKKKKKKKKKSKRGIIKKLKQLRYVTKIKKANMDHEQKLLARIERAKRKIHDLKEALKDYELPPLPPARHDPESLTAEELHYLKRLGYKHKNYMIMGVRGVFGGVVLNMHLHWKKHQLIKVKCKNYTKEEIHETGEQLARLSGGIVVDVQKGDTIVMYRGRNYTRPLDLTPKNTLSKRKALFKAKFQQSLESTTKNLLSLEKELALYREHKAKEEAGLFSGKPAEGYISSWSDTEDEQPTRPSVQDSESNSESEDIDIDHAFVCGSDSISETNSDSHEEVDTNGRGASDSGSESELDTGEDSDFSPFEEQTRL
ncbi:hypothetical protein GOP47_0004719 [Adiantum capillus-veneris]|uniref:CRM domain-containing protein n=1 Tax=Adiantum capillus-veneris TaxID=13818 RepID=A0A9D4ZNG7_ADICA|nr:hypothetical protein GOP47_0004719 [Adiantum capillus-veneris]